MAGGHEEENDKNDKWNGEDKQGYQGQHKVQRDIQVAAIVTPSCNQATITTFSLLRFGNLGLPFLLPMQHRVVGTLHPTEWSYSRKCVFHFSHRHLHYRPRPAQPEALVPPK